MIKSITYNKKQPSPFFNYFFTSSRHSIKASSASSLSPPNPPTLFFSQSRSFSSSDYSTFMEVVKAVVRQGSASRASVALIADQKSYCYSQLLASASRISRLLSDPDQKAVNGIIMNKDLGGARIGVVAKPSAEFVAGILATWMSGGVAVPLALSYPEAELLHVMTDATVHAIFDAIFIAGHPETVSLCFSTEDVSMILSTEDHSEIMQSVATKSAARFSLIPSVPNMPSPTTEHDQSNEGNLDADKSLLGTEYSKKIKEEDPALILYTSGTTGKPKGVVHTHKSILAQVETLASAWEYTSTDHFLHCLPLHHVHGLFNALFAPLYAGSTVEFMPKFSVRGIWQRWRESYPKDGTKADYAVTVFTGVPTMYTRLIQGYEAMDAELRDASASAASHLRLMMCGSSALPLPVMQQWETITGHRLLERYGMTEFVMALSNPLRGVRKGGTVGKPFAGVEVKILAEDDGSTGVGELCVKSPSLFEEYWKRPEVTKESFIDDGFFKTGDAVRVDEDGYYVILGRTNADIMKVGGYKLSALEIEAILLEHPAVSECCVLGLPDKTYGEAVTAIIVPDEEIKRSREKEVKPAISLDELSSWAKEKLAPYKLPTRLFLWDSLPRNAMGKVNKKELKTKLASEEQ